MKNDAKRTVSTVEQLDLFFDRRKLTPKQYFIVGIALSCAMALFTHVLTGHAFSWVATPLVIAMIVWILWLGPRYLQRYSRALVAGLGTVAFFAPTIVFFFMLWLGQPGWPLDSLMGDKYADFPAFLSTLALTLVVYGLLLLRMKLYSRANVKGHSKKDLFQ